MAFGSLPSVLGSGGGTAYSLIGGTGLFADGTAAAPSISFAADSDTGFYRQGANAIGLSCAGVLQLRFTQNNYILGAVVDNNLRLTDAGGVQLNCAGTNQNIALTPSGTGEVTIGGTSGVNSGAGYWLTGNANAGGTGITYPAVNTIGFYSGGEKARILVSGRFLLGTTTDSGALLQIGTNTTTSAGGMVFGTDCFLYRQGAEFMALDTPTSPSLLFRTAGTTRMLLQGTASRGSLSSVGSIALVLQTNLTDALTLDASQNATFAGSVTATAGNYTNSAGGFLTWSGRSRLYSPSDGVVLLSNTAVSDFSRLQFGGTTASFPALKRNSATLEAKLADDSAYTNFAASRYYNGSSNVFWAFGTGSPEGVVSASVGAIYSRTDGGAVTSFYVKESGAGNTGWVAK